MTYDEIACNLKKSDFGCPKDIYRGLTVTCPFPL